MPSILALVPYLPGITGGQRTTIEVWIPVLERAGFSIDVVPFESEPNQFTRPTSMLTKAAQMAAGVARRARTLQHLGEYDLAVVYREAAVAGPEVLERLVARRVPLVYVLDDPLFVPYRSPTNGWLSLLKVPAKIARICALASCVVVNGEPLAEFARAHCDNVTVIPNLVDGRYSPPLERPRADPVRLAWIGSDSTTPNLASIAASLQRLADRVDFELLTVGAAGNPVPGVKTIAEPWSAETEVDLLQTAHIGLVPLDGHPWNRWKFNFKLAQYMALGIPAVCTPLGSNKTIVVDGETGFLASTGGEWVDRLETLATQPELREKMGAAAAEYARCHFTVEANREKIVAAFRFALDRRAARR